MCAAAILIGMISLILVEIIVRTGFARSTDILEEMIGYGIAGMAFLAFGYSLENGAIIRMNLILQKLGNSRARQVIEVICCLSTMVFVVPTIWYFSKEVWRNYVRGYVSETMSETPLWIPKGLMLLGLTIFLLQLTAYLLKVLAGEVDYEAQIKGGGEDPAEKIASL